MTDQDSNDVVKDIGETGVGDVDAKEDGIDGKDIEVDLNERLDQKIKEKK